MGQSSSRVRRPSQTPVSTDQEGPSTAIFPSSSEAPVQTPMNRVRHTSDISGARKSSARKSFLNLVKPSTIRNRVSSIASSPGDLRRTWRNSRRWSKAPVDATLPSEDTEASSSGSLPVAGPSTLDKGKQKEVPVPVEEEDEDDQSYHEAPEEPQAQLPSNHSFTDIDEDSEPPCTDTDPISSSIEPPAASLNQPALSQLITENPPSLPSESVTTSTAPPATPRPNTVPLPPRQFPPPGTLVIVQGVVHTTDISRTAPQHEAPSQSASNSLDVPDEVGRSRTRNRLSELLRPRSSSRPASTVYNETSTSVDPSDRESPSPDTDGSRSLSEETVLTTPSLDERADSSQEPHSSPQAQEPSSSPPSDNNHSPSISSSSIDVLGTLLSVAAAATAASLLTGSSEPILSSALAPDQSSRGSMNASPPPPLSPASVFPRAAPDVSAASRAERMRQAWSTIRERLGLRPSTNVANQQPPGEVTTNPATHEDGTSISPADARELMLAEMARAFNIGLGLNGMNGESSSTPGAPADSEAVGGSSPTEATRTADSTPPSTSSNPPQPIMPPEGSFERFLVDLQVDLRNALTHVQGSISDTAETQPVVLPPSTTPVSESVESSPSPPTNNSSSDSPPAAEVVDVSSSTSLDVTAGTQTCERGVGTDQNYSPEGLPDGPSRHGADDEDNEDFNSMHPQPDHPDPPTSTSNDRESSSSSGTGRIDAAGRINWWRLYRFPAITSSVADLASRSRQSNMPTATPTPPTMATAIPDSNPPSVNLQEQSQASSSSASPSASSSSTSPTESSSSSSTSSPSPTQPQPIRSVVPVIIVGLQSVHSPWRSETPNPSDNDSMSMFGSGEPTTPEAARNEFGDEGDLDGWDGLTGTDGATRGRGRSRGWPSRAADALRNLRSGRRNPETGTAGAQTGPGANGSRTFMIYVIGGYYPPDHNIVTGGPANFDSFEALLELAELLGQVKPPTASKDDIDNSGLEVVKASMLSKLFEDGRVTANCIDRCLICLEDYEPEEDLRLMTCRHAFHQQCVDHWMQTGRNNCPACRSTGVSTEPRSPTSTTA